MTTAVRLALLAALFAGPLGAQVNTERLRRTDLAAGVSGQAGLDFTLREGNVELVLLAPSGRVDVVGDGWTLFLVAQGDLGWQRGERFSNQGLAHLRYGRQAASRLRLEGFTQVDYDRARQLTLRTLAGAGPRVTLLATDGWEVALGTAYMLEHEELELPAAAAHPRETTVSRWSSYLTARGAAGERLAGVTTVYVQPQFSDFGDLRVLGDARLSVQLAGALSLQTSGVLRWDGRPPDGTEELDLTVRTGVSVEW